MGSSESCFPQTNKEEANINFLNENKQQSEHETKEQSQEKKTYEMLLGNNLREENSTPSNNISMVLYEDKIFISKPKMNSKEVNIIEIDSDCIDNNFSNDNDFIIDLDHEVYDKLDQGIIKPINPDTQKHIKKPLQILIEKTPTNNNISNLTTHSITDKNIFNETVNERSNSQYTQNNKEKIKEIEVPKSRDTISKMTSIHQRTSTITFSNSFDMLDNKTIALYKINTKITYFPAQVKSMKIDSLFSIEKLNNCTNRDILFQSELEKVSPVTLKLIKSYCVITKTNFSIYKSKEAFLFRQKAQYTFKLDLNTRIGFISLSKPPVKSQGLTYYYILFRYNTTSIVLSSQNDYLLCKWLLLIQYLLSSSYNIQSMEFSHKAN